MLKLELFIQEISFIYEMIYLYQFNGGKLPTYFLFSLNLYSILFNFKHLTPKIILYFIAAINPTKYTMQIRHQL